MAALFRLVKYYNLPRNLMDNTWISRRIWHNICRLRKRKKATWAMPQNSAKSGWFWGYPKLQNCYPFDGSKSGIASFFFWMNLHICIVNTSWKYGEHSFLFMLKSSFWRLNRDPFDDEIPVLDAQISTRLLMPQLMLQSTSLSENQFHPNFWKLNWEQK